MPYASAVSDPASLRVSPWITAAAWAVPLCILPSALWRLTVIVNGAPAEGACRDTYTPAWYLISLSAGSMALGLLTVGLVRPWGEVFPRWLPWIGGRRGPAKPVTIIALTGATILSLLVGYAVVGEVNSFFDWYSPPTFAPAFGAPDDLNCTIDDLDPSFLWWYTPLVAWPPLLFLVTFNYRRRHAELPIERAL